MDDIYEDIVRVGNNLDTLNIKREELQNSQQDLNQNRTLHQSQVQPIPMHVSKAATVRHSQHNSLRVDLFLFYSFSVKVCNVFSTTKTAEM